MVLISQNFYWKGYIVHGIKRRSSSLNTERIDHIYQDYHESNKNFHLHYGDLTDSLSVFSLIQKIRPDEVYNLEHNLTLVFLLKIQSIQEML